MIDFFVSRFIDARAFFSRPRPNSPWNVFFRRESPGLMPSLIVVHLNVIELGGAAHYFPTRDPYFRSSLITRQLLAIRCSAWVATIRVSSHMGESHIKAPGEMRTSWNPAMIFRRTIELLCVCLFLLYLYLVSVHIILCVLYSCMECMEWIRLNSALS